MLRVVDAKEVIKLLALMRWPLSDEKRLQEMMADHFLASKVLAKREVRLDAGDIIDFMIGSVGLEVKVKGSKREIYRQCVRYCEHDAVSELVLASNVALGLPRVINGKPVHLVALGRGWL